MRGLMEGADPDRLAAALKQMGRDAPPAQGLWFMQWVADGLTSQDAGKLAEIIPLPVRLISKVVAGGIQAGAVGRVRLTCCPRPPQGRYSPASPNSCHR